MKDWIHILNTLTLAKLGSRMEEEQLPYKVRELLPVTGKAEIEVAEHFYKERMQKARREGSIIPFERLCEICNYNKTVKNFLQTSLAVYTYPQLKELFRRMGENDGLTLELIQELFLEEGEDLPSYKEQKISYELLSRILKPSGESSFFMRKSFSMDERIYGYLLGEEEPLEEVKLFLNPEPVKEELGLWIHKKQAEELMHAKFRLAKLRKRAL